MSALQTFFMATLPKRWAESMREESMRWQIRCCTCDTTRSFWELGAIRWKAASTRKRIMFRCPTCQKLRAAAVKKLEACLN